MFCFGNDFCKIASSEGSKNLALISFGIAEQVLPLEVLSVVISPGLPKAIMLCGMKWDSVEGAMLGVATL